MTRKCAVLKFCAGNMSNIQPGNILLQIERIKNIKVSSHLRNKEQHTYVCPATLLDSEKYAY